MSGLKNSCIYIFLSPFFIPSPLIHYSELLEFEYERKLKRDKFSLQFDGKALAIEGKDDDNREKLCILSQDESAALTMES